MRTAFYYASAVLLGLAFGIVGVLYLERVRNTAVPIPPMPIETEQVAPQPPLPPSLDDIQVTVIRVGTRRDALVGLETQHNDPYPFISG